MKRFIAIFPIIIVLLISNMAGLNVRAADDVATTWTNYVTNKEYTDIDLIKNKSVAFDYLYDYCGSPENYLVFQVVHKYTSGADTFCQIGLYLIHSDSAIDIAIENAEEQEVYTISSSGTMYCDYIQNEWYMTSTAITAFRQGSFGVNNKFSTGYNGEFVFYPAYKALNYTENGTEYEPFKNYLGVYPDYVLTDFISDGSLDLTVTFNPGLTGAVERINEVNGVTYSQKGFTMRVTNNSSKAAQYRMAILKQGSTIHDSFATNGNSSDIAYMYYSNDWVYSPSLDNAIDHFNNQFYKYHKSTAWHYVAPGETDSQYFDWSQLPIEDNVQYTVVVEAIGTDYDIGSEIFVQMASEGEAYPELKQLQYDDVTNVYSSTFTVTYLGDIQYDYTNNANGVVPYNGESDFQRNAYSYDAKENTDGTINYDNVNLYDDTDSWLHSSDFVGNGDYTYNYGNDSYVYKDFNYGIEGFLNNTTVFFSFMQHAFSFLPSWYFSIISFGLFAIIFIAILHRL